MDETGVAAAYKEYGGAVFARCLRILRDEDAARDVTQEVFVRCFDRRDELRAGRELLGWLYRVATNLCLNTLRDARSRGAANRQASPAPPVAPAEPRRRAVQDLLAGLDDRTQSIVVYVYLDGMTHAEAAEVAGVSDRTVRTCLARFLEHGRGLIAESDGPQIEEGCG